MLVQFERATTRSPFVDEDEDGLPVAGQVETKPISINPQNVSAVFDDGDTPGVVIIRLMDGRGFKVLGNHDDVVAKIEGAIGQGTQVS